MAAPSHPSGERMSRPGAVIAKSSGEATAIPVPNRFCRSAAKNQVRPGMSVSRPPLGMLNGDAGEAGWQRGPSTRPLR